ncbi:hypothetical protein [Streptomyces sp. NPDC057257]|uniref:hypothetical protein n=1 Tax=Streptomyces sp. NPDC057257 TaxID=3346071 RepID=UPI00363A63F3
MTPYQSTALGCRLAALAATGSGVWAWAQEEWVPLACLGWSAVVLVLIGGRCQSAHLTVRATHERARRAARTDPAVLACTPVPCCSVWRHTDGALHDPACTHPAAASHSYRLDPGTAAAFEDITAHFDDRSPA